MKQEIYFDTLPRGVMLPNTMGLVMYSVTHKINFAVATSVILAHPVTEIACTVLQT